MNCNEYKEAIAAEPNGEFEGFEHAESCADCSAFRDEMRALDSRIHAAMNIDVPELKMPELPPIDEDSNVVGLPYRSKNKWQPTWFAAAASILIAAVFGLRFATTQVEFDSLEAEILAHLDHEPHALRVTTETVSERRLGRVVSKEVASLDRDVGLITYAKSCVINGKEIPHLVMQGEKGPITLLLLPDEKIDAAIQLEGAGINGYILPHGNGSIAIIGDKYEQMTEVEKKVLDSVEWTT